LVVDGVVVDVSTVNKRDGFFGIDKRLVITRNNFGDGNFVPPIQVTLRDAGNIDGWVRSTNIEKTNKKACILGFSQMLGPLGSH
jgi:hypothetical protein